MNGRPKSYNPHQIMHQAMQVFWRKGYVETSIRDLSEATGLTTGSLYHEFEGKEGCFVAVLRHYIETIVRPRVESILFKAACQPTPDPFNAIQHFIVSSFYPVPEPFARQACLLLNTTLDARLDTDAIQVAVNEGVNLLKEGYRHVLYRAQSQGAIPQGADLDTLIQQIFVFHVGVLSLSKVTPDPLPLVKATEQQIRAMKIALLTQ